jgi:hypothetical protein
MRKPLDISPLISCSVSTHIIPRSVLLCTHPHPCAVLYRSLPLLFFFLVQESVDFDEIGCVDIYWRLMDTDSAVLRIESSAALRLFPSTHVPHRMFVHLAFHTPLFSSTRSLPKCLYHAPYFLVRLPVYLVAMFFYVIRTPFSLFIASRNEERARF